MFESEQSAIREKIQEFLIEQGLSGPFEIAWSSIPFSGEWGISTSFFQVAAREARAGKKVRVPQRAQEIAEGVAEYLGVPPGFHRVEATKGYLNLYYSPAVYAQRVIDTVLAEGEKFGMGAPKNQRVMFEYSQPNTHKAFHVGHLRNVILGEAMCNIYEAAGYEVIRANYVGDIGLHVIKWLWNYQKYHAGEEPGEDRTRWMGDLYAEAVRHLEEKPELEGEVRELFMQWDRHDPNLIALWKKSRQWSLDGFEQIYKTLGVHFDHYFFESEVEESGKELVKELIQRGIAIDERPDGPVIIRLDDILGLKKEKYRVMVILRSDGTSLYATKDLPLAIMKFEQFNLDRSVYVIDVRQSLYLQQIFKTLEIMGYVWAKNCYHLSYEIVNLPGNVTMSSREGTVVLLEDLIREATQRALEIVSEKNPSLDDNIKQDVAKAVALGAIKYPMLSRENTKMVTFDWESALDFNGHAAPYIQYAHVRANSILKKAEKPVLDSVRPEFELTKEEIELIDLLSRLPGEVQKSAQEYKTLHLTNLVYDIAKAFNDFYRHCPVVKADPQVRAFRLRLVNASRQVLANTLSLLGIESPEVM
ncbi:MAG: arginine--tRNA ligase [Anaerolineales bacterium]|nr:arginine--tRNA ligase [Anaerolineales bacterium]